MSKKNLSIVASFFVLTFVAVSFQNCAKVQMEAKPEAASLSSTGVPLDQNGNPTDVTGLDQQSVNQKATLKANNNFVDIILMVDNSGSMKADSLKLASRLEGFINLLAGSQIDWQMCLLTSDMVKEAGKPVNWKKTVAAGTSYVLTKNDSNISKVFENTIESLFDAKGDGDERGIAALRANLTLASASKCYRTGSVVNTIVLSDEDEKSVGGDIALQAFMTDANQNAVNFPLIKIRSNDYPTLNSAQLLALTIKNSLDEIKKSGKVEFEDSDKPSSYANAFKTAFPASRLISNSIVIKSGDYQCLQTQMMEGLSQITPTLTLSYFGKSYEELSGLTGGKIGSICASDFTSVLNDFASAIKSAFGTIQLDCDPVDGKVSMTMTKGSEPVWTRSGRTISVASFSQDIEMQVKYACWVPKK